jgi:hypothetical protein
MPECGVNLLTIQALNAPDFMFLSLQAQINGASGSKHLGCKISEGLV